MGQSEDRARLVAPSRLALDDLLAELLRRTREIVDVRDGLWKLIEAVVSVASSELSLARPCLPNHFGVQVSRAASTIPPR